MKIDCDCDSPIPQNCSNEQPASPKNVKNEVGNPGKDKIIISEEGREALSESMDDISTATALVEKIASAYPEKDLKLKINDIVLEATESKLPNKLNGLIGSILSKIMK